MLQEVGMPADYVNKLARMFQDIKVSEDLNQVFKEVHKHNKLALPGDLQAQFFYIYICAFTLPLIGLWSVRFFTKESWKKCIMVS